MFGHNRTSTSRAIATTSALATGMAAIILWSAPAQATIGSVVVDGVTYTANDANLADGATATSFTMGPTSVTIPDTVTITGQLYAVKHIGHDAFKGMGLTSLTLGAEVETIGNSAFMDNALTTVTIPAEVNLIDEFAFYNNDLVSATIPEGVTSIQYAAFSFNDLTSVTLPSTLLDIQSNTFARNKLTSITIPSGITTIGIDAFYDNKLTNVSLPSSLTTINGGAFDGNLLTSVTIPALVQVVGNSAFNENPSLASATFLGAAPATIGAATGISESFDTANAGFTIFFSAPFAAGFTPSPWNGYTTMVGAPPTAAPGLTGAATALGETDLAFTYNATVTGNPTPVVTLTGTLPTGLTFSGGQISGIPTQAGVFPVTIHAANGVGADASLPVTITIHATVITGLAPTITGTVGEGGVLTAHAGPVVPASTLTYQWRRYGTVIPGATAATYKLRASEVGRKVSVTITASHAGLASTTATSALTPFVSSPNTKLILATNTIHRGAAFSVVATGLKPGQRYIVWLGGKNSFTGQADARGIVARSVKFPTSIKPGVRRVRVSAYVGSKRTYTLFTMVRYLK